MCVNSYKKLGIKSKLNHAAGGAEKDFTKPAAIPDQSSISTSTTSTTSTTPKKQKLGANEARIERDDAGNVVRIVYGAAAGESATDSEQDDEEEFKGFDQQEEPTTEVVRQLEEMARNAPPPVPRVQSEREQDWIGDLVEKHGEDYEAMKWDKKLNVYQQSAGDLRRRILKWKKSQK